VPVNPQIPGSSSGRGETIKSLNISSLYNSLSRSTRVLNIVYELYVMQSDIKHPLTYPCGNLGGEISPLSYLVVEDRNRYPSNAWDCAARRQHDAA
jgi:hypothetical protein